MLTATQVDRATRSGNKLTKEWRKDSEKTGRSMTAERIQKIAAQDARYSYDNADKQKAHAAIVVRVMGRNLLASDEYIAMSESIG